MRVLVTGCAGYIGSVLVHQLLNKGYEVKGFDSLIFGGESLISVYNHPKFEFVRGDIRNEKDLSYAVKDVDAVVHLAAIVGDPACAKQPDLAKSTNLSASQILFEMCRSATRVKRFIFASTCSNYGKMETDGYVNENSILRPVSLYAELKVHFEKHILNSSARNDFGATILRFATVYGLSPRPRFDLTVNEFVRDATFAKTLQIYGGQFWRPYCHVNDLAKSCILVLESPLSKVNKNVFNVGDTDENYQKKMLVSEISKIIPDIKVEYVERSEDPRDYKVEFSKISDQLGFSITKRVSNGIVELHSVLKNGLLSDPYSPRYRNS